MNRFNPVSKVTEEDEIAEKDTYTLYNLKSDRLEFKIVYYGENKALVTNKNSLECLGTEALVEETYIKNLYAITSFCKVKLDIFVGFLCKVILDRQQSKK
ncbi:MAG: hypothetical protein AAGE96_14780 [Cyanobacteria bacterium P01_G01_bin.19]